VTLCIVDLASLIIATQIESNPFALSMSKGRSWFDRLTTNGQACPELAEGLTTNGVRYVNSHVWRIANHRQESAAKKAFSYLVVPISIGMLDCQTLCDESTAGTI